MVVFFPFCRIQKNDEPVLKQRGINFAHLQILQIFHRKVYPESAALVRNLTKKSRRRGSGADEPAEPASSKLRCRKEQRAPGFGCCANRASFGGAASPIHDDDEELNSSKSGHWIKTDAECERIFISFHSTTHTYILQSQHSTYLSHPNPPIINLQSQKAVLTERLSIMLSAKNRIFRSYQFSLTAPW